VGPSDLLKRHAASHDVDERGGKRQRTSETPARPRVSQACAACAAAKLKCEQEKPCQRCQQKQIHCDFAPNRVADRRDEQRGQRGGVSGSAGVEFDTLNSQATTTNNPGDKTPPVSMQIPTTSLEGDPLMDFDDSSLADFLKEIMHTSPDAVARPLFADPASTYTPRDVLNFGIDTTFDFSDIDFGLPPPPPLPEAERPTYTANNLANEQAPGSGTRTPELRNSINLGTQAFRKSVWQFIPSQEDHGYAEQLNLSLPYQDIDSPEIKLAADLSISNQQLDQSSRDRILAMILSTCEPRMFPRVVSSFPSAELLDNLMHQFFSFELSRTDSWIHLPTFRLNGQRPELTGIIAAAGAVLSTVQVVRKLGFAIQEAVRLALPKIFEADNTTTRDLQILQAYALELNVGLWSGDRRKMEMAESFAQPVITMLRRAGHFRRSKAHFIIPLPSDDGEALETKWRNWVEAESFKRLAFHLFINDAQASMSLLAPPLISYAELSVELPQSRALWLAKNAHDWKGLCLAKGSGDRLPHLAQCIHDVTPLSKSQGLVDLQMSILIILYGIWSLIWEYRQLNSVAKLQSAEHRWNGALMSSSWHQELCQLLYHFRMHASEWEDGMKPEAILIHERSLMNLHVSFEDVQLFAGKEGDEEARRAYPLLKQWAETRESRQAVWHAGQVLRAATECHPKQLREFSAVALYHASLAFWAYAVVSRPSKSARKQPLPASQHQSNVTDHELVWLDGEDGPDVQRFIAVGRGMPVIRDWTKDSGAEQEEKYAALSDVKAVMDITITILRQNETSDERMSPPLVKNLSQLMRDLGNAALGIGRP
jgi:Fungal specific transcription factor domain/Fungal Zn(2)-Cys(6) binuclear cluster domain